jgi:CBS domain-containing protein
MLFLFGGVAQIASEPPTPRAEFLVAVAGPSTSLVLAAAARLGEPLLGVRPLADIAHYLAIVNLLLGAFNLVPGFPLDGGRILRAALWSRSGSLERATQAAARAGQLVAMLFIGTGVLYILRGNLVTGIWFIILGWFLDTAAQSSYQQAVVRHGLGEIRVSEIMSHDLHTLEPGMTVERAIDDHFVPRKHGGFPVLFGDHLVGIVTLQDVTAVPVNRRSAVTIREVMTPRDRLRTISISDTAYAAFAKMAQDNLGRLLVLDEKGTLAGIITRSDLLHVLRLRIDRAT